MKIACKLASGLVVWGLTAASQAALDSAQAGLANAKGDKVGTVMLTETVHGVLIKGELHDLPPGVHGFHVHATGKCEPPSFESAGGHFNPTEKEHGFMAVEGVHAGDLPNVHVGADGKAEFETVTREITLGQGTGANSVFDEDGSALVLHERADDYLSKPAGNSGPRIACGVIEKTATR